MYRNILVAVDGSAHSLRALQHAAKLAQAFDSRIFLVHVYPSSSDIVGYSDYDSLVAKREAKGQAVLDAVRTGFEDLERVTESLVEGPEAEAVLKAAETHGADLIVMGSRGLSAVKRWLLGSLSQKVSYLADCPVLLVR